MDSGQNVIIFFFLVLLTGLAISIGGGLSTGIVAATNHQEVTVESAELGQSTVETGESVEVTAEIRNPKNSTESFIARLRVDGEIRAQQIVEMPPNSTETITFEEFFDEEGSYSISVNDVTAGELTVSDPDPAEFLIRETVLSDQSVTVGERVSIETTVENVGDTTDVSTVRLLVEREPVDSEIISLSGGETTSRSVGFTPEQTGTYDLIATTDDDAEVVGSVEVTEPAEPEFDVYALSISEDRIQEGEQVTITATVENVGDASGNYSAPLQIDGETVDTTTVTVPSGETREVSFQRQFETAGEYDVAIGETAPTTLTVLAPPDLEVINAEVSPQTVTTDESVSVEATIENTGDVSGETTVNLEIDGGVVESQTVTVDGGETRTVEFGHQFDETGEKTVSVNSELAGTVSVLAPANFVITDASLSRETILEEESVVITAEVENTGDVAGTFDADLRINGETVESKSRSIDDGTSELISFQRTFDEAGSYTIGVGSTTAGELTVDQPATFSITETAITSTEILETETTTITATVENTGDREGIFQAVLEIDGETVESTPVTVAGGESREVSFEREFEQAGTYDISVSGIAAGSVTVLAPADLSVTDAETGTDSLTTEQTVGVETTVENTGDVAGETTIELEIDGSVVASRQVTVNGRATETIEFTVGFEETGEKSVTVNGISAGTLAVLAPAELEITDTAVSETTIEEGETVSITADVRNIGGVSGTFEVPLEVDTNRVGSREVTLGSNQSTVVSFEQTFDEAGEYPIQINERSVGTVDVLVPADLSVVAADVTANSLTTDESLRVEVTVANSGEVSGSRTVGLAMDGDVVDQTEIQVPGGEEREIRFTRTFEETGERRVTVGGQFAGDVSVLAPAELVVTSATVEEETILETDSVTVTADIENIGDVVGTGSATLAVDGESVESRSVTVNGGSSRQVSFETTVPDAGIYEFRVNGETAGEVTVEQPATLSVENAAVSETVILENNSISVGARLENTGDRGGTFSVGLAINGSETASRELRIAAGDSTIVEFEHRFDTAGTYNVSIAGVAAGTVLVEQPASVELTGTELEPETVLLTDPVEIKPTVKNSGDRTGTVSIEVAAENNTIEQRNVSVGPQSTETVQVTESFDKVGEYTITVNNSTAGTVRVEQPPDFEVTEATVPADWAAPGTTTTLEAVVENPSQWRVTRPVNVTVDAELVTQEQVTLGPGENKEVTIEFNATGGSVSVNGFEAGTLAASEITEDDSTPNSTEDDGENARLFVTVPVLVAMIGAGWYIFTNMGSGGREI